jgi:hypothetical protein
VAFPSVYCAAELLTGKIFYPVRGYDGYGDGTGEDLRAFIDDVMHADWAAHRDALLAFWISGRWSSELPNTKPWLFYRGAPGTRPWAWWMLEDHPPINDDESEDEYLTRTKQWLPGERALFEVTNLKPDDAGDHAVLSHRPPARARDIKAAMNGLLQGSAA